MKTKAIVVVWGLVLIVSCLFLKKSLAAGLAGTQAPSPVEKAKEADNTRFVGSWVCMDTPRGMELEIKADGKFTMMNLAADSPDKGTYTIEGDVIVLRYSGMDLVERLTYGKEDGKDVLKNNTDDFTFHRSE